MIHADGRIVPIGGRVGINGPTASAVAIQTHVARAARALCPALGEIVSEARRRGGQCRAEALSRAFVHIFEARMVGIPRRLEEVVHTEGAGLGEDSSL